MQTSIYHIAYCEHNKEADLFFWGCNMDCRGCYCKRRIYSPMLKDFAGAHLCDPKGIVEPPDSFLKLDEVMGILSEVELKSVVMEGQEASIDPVYLTVTKAVKENFGSYNTLLTNALELPDLTYTDKVEVGIKAITASLHRHYTGTSNSKVMKNLARLRDMGKELIVESVLIPNYIEADEIERIARFVASVDKEIPFVVLPYFKSGDNPWRRPTPDEMEQAANLARKHLEKVFSFRGDEELDFEVKSLFPEYLNAIDDHKRPSAGRVKQPVSEVAYV